MSRGGTRGESCIIVNFFIVVITPRRVTLGSLTLVKASDSGPLRAVARRLWLHDLPARYRTPIRRMSYCKRRGAADSRQTGDLLPFADLDNSDLVLARWRCGIAPRRPISSSRTWIPLLTDHLRWNTLLHPTLLVPTFPAFFGSITRACTPSSRRKQE